MLNGSTKNKIYEIFEKYPLVGLYADFNDNEIEDILKESSNFLKDRHLYHTSYNSLIIFLSFVILAKNWEPSKDGGLYEYLSIKLLGYKKELFIHHEIKEILNSILSNETYKNFFFIKSYGRKYYTTICSNAISPKSSLQALFQLCFDIYLKDLGNNYASNKDLLPIILKNLKNKILAEPTDQIDENIKIGSKTYDLRVGTKGIIIDNENLSTFILNRIFENFDLFTSNCQRNEKYNYIDEIEQDWFKLNQEYSHNLKRNGKIVTDYKSIKPQYYIENGEVYIQIPSFILHDNSNYDPYLEILINDKASINNVIMVLGSGLSWRTEQQIFKLNSLINNSKEINLRVIITIGNKTIYDSQNSLNRAFILLDEHNNEETKTSLSPGSYYLYTLNKENIIVPKNTQLISKNTYYLEAKEEDYIKYKDIIISFSLSNDDEYKLILSEMKNCYFIENNIKYSVISTDVYLLLKPTINWKDVYIKTSKDEKIKLFDIYKTITEDGYLFNLTNCISCNEPLTIDLVNISKNTLILSINIFKSQNLQMQFDKELYYLDNYHNSGKLYLKINDSILEKPFILSSENQNKYFINLKYKNGYFSIELPVLKRCFDKREFISKPVTFYYDKVLANSSILKIDFPSDKDYIIGNTKNNSYFNKNNKFSVGQEITSLTFSDTVNLSYFLKTNEACYELFQVYLKPCFIDNPLSIENDNKIIAFSPNYYIGPEDLSIFLLIFDLNDNLIIREPLDLNNQNVINFDETIQDGVYIAKIVAEKSGLFHETFECYKTESFTLGNIKNSIYKNKILKISEVLDYEKKIQTIKPFFIDNLKFIKTTDDGLDNYSGNLFIIKNNKKKYINYANDLDHNGNLEKVNPLRIEFISPKKCYIYTGFDVDSDDLDYLSEFLIAYNGKITLDESKSFSKFIDLYFYKIIEEEK